MEFYIGKNDSGCASSSNSTLEVMENNLDSSIIGCGKSKYFMFESMR